MYKCNYLGRIGAVLILRHILRTLKSAQNSNSKRKEKNEKLQKDIELKREVKSKVPIFPNKLFFE